MMFKYSGILIIDLIPDNELHSARKLQEDILDAKYKVANDDFERDWCKLVRCHNNIDFLRVLEELIQYTEENGISPVVHIDAHADKDFLFLPDETTIAWEKIFQKLREINIGCKNNLFVSCSACLSAFALKTSIPGLNRAAVVGFLAPQKEINAGEVTDAFSEYYKALIDTNDIQIAWEAFINVVSHEQDYVLIDVDDLFFYASLPALLQSKGKKRNIRVNKLLNEFRETQEQLGRATKDIDKLIPWARRTLKEELKSGTLLYIKEVYQKFMMVDLYPENAQRFIFQEEQLEGFLSSH